MTKIKVSSDWWLNELFWLSFISSLVVALREKWVTERKWGFSLCIVDGLINEMVYSK